MNYHYQAKWDRPFKTHCQGRQGSSVNNEVELKELKALL